MMTSENRKIILELDKEDFQAVHQAIAIRQGFAGGKMLPEGGGNLVGRIVAEICRGWMEMLDRDEEATS